MKWQKEVQELQAAVVEETAIKLRLQMELDSKDSEIEQLQIKLASLCSETASLSSADNENDDAYMSGNTHRMRCMYLFSTMKMWEFRLCELNTRIIRYLNTNVEHKP